MNAKRWGMVLRWIMLTIVAVVWPYGFVTFCAISAFIEFEEQRWVRAGKGVDDGV